MRNPSELLHHEASTSAWVLHILQPLAQLLHRLLFLSIVIEIRACLKLLQRAAIRDSNSGAILLIAGA